MSAENKRLWRQKPETKAKQQGYERTYRERHHEEIKRKRKPRDRRIDRKRKILAVELRHKAIMTMGGRCERCSFDIEDALQIDHIVPINRRTCGIIGRNGTWTMYTKIVDGDLTNVQLLCANCHAIKTKREDRALRLTAAPKSRLPLFDLLGIVAA